MANKICKLNTIETEINDFELPVKKIVFGFVRSTKSEMRVN